MGQRSRRGQQKRPVSAAWPLGPQLGRLQGWKARLLEAGFTWRRLHFHVWRLRLTVCWDLRLELLIVAPTRDLSLRPGLRLLTLQLRAPKTSASQTRRSCKHLFLASGFTHPSFPSHSIDYKGVTNPPRFGARERHRPAPFKGQSLTEFLGIF